MSDESARPEISQSVPSSSSQPEMRSISPPSSGGDFVRRCLATHNPLYAVSAALVFYGLRISFAVEASEHAMILLGALGAYVGLLTMTAIMLRRVGALWEDMRMLALLVLLLLLGISVTFDRTILVDADVGRACFAIAWLFSALVCEVMSAGLGVRLPLGYRLPFHLLLALFFVYPPLAAHMAAQADDERLTWTLFSFSTAAAAALLTVIPAARRGAELVAANGTPWRWPWFPGTIFFVMGLGVVGRAYYLCYSFHAVPDGESIFGVYFLTPLAMAVGLIMLVAGRRTRTRIVALMVPAACVLVAGIQSHHDVTSQQFLYRFNTAFGAGPQSVALWIGIAFYAAAVVRRVPGSWACLCGSVLLTSLIHGPSWLAPTCDAASPWSFAAAALIASVAAVRRDSTLWAWVAVCCIGFTAASVGGRTSFAALAFSGSHAAVFAAVVFGAYFGGARGRWFQAAAGGVLLVAFTEAVTRGGSGFFGAAPIAATYYPLVVLAVAGAYAVALHDRWVFGFLLMLATEWVGMSVGREYLRWRRTAPGLDAVALGLASFVAAVACSLFKSEWYAALRATRRLSEVDVGDEPDTA